MLKLSGDIPGYNDSWLDDLDRVQGNCSAYAATISFAGSEFRRCSNLTHQHKSFIARILWLEQWLERQESQFSY